MLVALEAKGAEDIQVLEWSKHSIDEDVRVMLMLLGAADFMIFDWSLLLCFVVQVVPTAYK